MRSSPAFSYLLAEALECWPWLFLSMAAAAALTAGLLTWHPLRFRAEVPLHVRIDYLRPQALPVEMLYVQAEHLQEAFTSPQVVQDVHAHLPPAWQQRLSIHALRRRLVVDWRLSERWYLVAYGTTPEEARIVVTTWADRLMARWIPAWEQATQQHLARERRLWLTHIAWVQARRYAAWARAAREHLSQWMEDQSTLSQEEPLPPEEWTKLRFWITIAWYGPEPAGLNPPSPQAPRKHVLAWVKQHLLPRLAVEEAAARAAAHQAETDREALQGQEDQVWLSPWYEVTVQRAGEVQIYGLPRPATAAVLGTVLGIGAWVFGLLAWVSLGTRSSWQEPGGQP